MCVCVCCFLFSFFFYAVVCLWPESVEMEMNVYFVCSFVFRLFVVSVALESETKMHLLGCNTMCCADDSQHSASNFPVLYKD